MQDLLTVIKNRYSSRISFAPEHKVSRDDLHKILEAGSWAPKAHNMQNFEVVIVIDKKLIESIASAIAPTSLTFVKENFKQLSFSEEELRAKKTGVLGTMFPPAWIKPDVKESDITNADRDSFMREELNTTPVLGIVLYNPARRAPASEGDLFGNNQFGLCDGKYVAHGKCFGHRFSYCKFIKATGLMKKK